jgi:hypothetical protein
MGERLPAVGWRSRERTPDAHIPLCGVLSSELYYPVRITRFVTADSRESVLRFYKTALVEHGSYQVLAREGHRVWFQDEALITSEVSASHDPNGYGLYIEAMAVSGGTAVWITGYTYDRSPLPCHL